MEFNIEAPEDIAEEVAIILQKCMEQGAKPFCTRLPLSTDISITLLLILRIRIITQKTVFFTTRRLEKR